MIFDNVDIDPKIHEYIHYSPKLDYYASANQISRRIISRHYQIAKMAASVLRVPSRILHRNMKDFNLKGVKNVKLSFDPFHKNVESLRLVKLVVSIVIFDAESSRKQKAFLST